VGVSLAAEVVCEQLMVEPVHRPLVLDRLDDVAADMLEEPADIAVAVSSVRCRDGIRHGRPQFSR
jgi:hypothetical protein